MAYTPSGIISMCNVPFSTDRAHTRYFTTEQEQKTYFSSRVINTSLNYTFLRKDNIIRVPYNIEQIRNCNYVYYINQNFGNKIFYNFVTQVEYINENTTALHIQQDDFQTWMFNIRFLKSFVDREHTNNDTKYNKNNIEVEDFYFDSYIKNHFTNIFPNKIPNTIGLNINCIIVVSSQTMIGDKKQSTPSTKVNTGIQFYYYALFDLTSDGLIKYTEYIESLNTNGIIDSVVNVFCTDKSFANNITYFPNTNIIDSISIQPLSINAYDDVSIDGYIPKNNKIYNYPFRYMEVGGDTSSKQFKYEYFTEPENMQDFTISAYPVLLDRLYIMVMPWRYSEINIMSDEALTGIENGIQIAAGYDIPYYKNTAEVTYALNKNTLETTLANSRRDLLTHLITGAMDVYTTNTVGAGMAGAAFLTGGITGAVTSIGSTVISGERTVTDTINTAISDANKLRYAHAKISDVSALPTIPTGSYSNDYVKYASSGYFAGIREYTIPKSLAEKADNYLSVYGYKTNKFKIPNLTGRARWNYVKTSGINIAPKTSGIIPPSTDIENIKNIFNNGITLWHDNNIMDYGDFSNDIIT